MKRWIRPGVVLAVWIATVVLVAEHGAALGAYRTVPWALAVAVTGALLGAWPGAASGAIVGAFVAFGLDLRGQDPVGWATVLAEGGLLLPVVLGGIGVGSAIGRKLQKQLLHHRDASDRAQYDVLTGALHRRSFERRLEERIRRHGPGDPGFAVLFVDLDRFKFVNDTFGHGIGDKLLVEITRLLLGNVREGDLVSRQGGDEFVVALHGVRDAAAAAAVAAKLVEQIGSPFHIDGKLVSVSASVGVALYPKDGTDVHTILKSADAAMYAAKAAGKNSFNFSSHEQRHRQARRLEIEQQLRFALREHEFEVLYQPQLELATGRLVGFEALLRWNNGVLGTVEPTEFVPIAEDAGMILPIGHWLLRAACLQAQAWSVLDPQLIMAINVSSLQFRQPDFVTQVGAAIRDTGIDAERIELEVTERVLSDQFDLAVKTLAKLDRMGVRTALDDFGTGYSSLAYLQRLPIRSLKIDRSFVRELQIGPDGTVGDALPIVEAIAALGLKLGKVVVAEGVETEAQARCLQQVGVAVGQGFHYAKPMNARQAEALLRRLAQGPGGGPWRPPHPEIARGPWPAPADDGFLLR